jgi:hypothetical protein
MNKNQELRWTGAELKLLNDHEAPPIELPMSFFVRQGGFVYKNLDVMAKREYSAPNTETGTRLRTSASSPERKKKHEMRKPRFVFWLFKGTSSIQNLLNEYFSAEIINKKRQTFNDFVIKHFYLEIFPGEASALQKLNSDQDMWHLLLVGHVHKPFIGELSWQIISACSFKLIDDGSVLLLWIATSHKKAKFQKWTSQSAPKHKGKSDKSEVAAFFDGRSFNQGRGIRTTMLVIVEEAMEYLVSVLYPKDHRMYQRKAMIFCQAAMDPYVFYKVSAGMVALSTGIHEFPSNLKESLMDCSTLRLVIYRRNSTMRR